MKFKIFRGPNMQVIEDALNNFFKNIEIDQFHLATGKIATGELIILVGYTEKVY